MTKKRPCASSPARAPNTAFCAALLQKLAAKPPSSGRAPCGDGRASCAGVRHTVREIEADGMPIAARIPILKFGTGSALATARTVSLCAGAALPTISAAHRPDMVLVLGDRYEIFAVGRRPRCWASRWRISRRRRHAGAADDWFRHCLTKMASLHFPVL